MSKQELSYDTKTIITILLLVCAYPIGVILMYRWMNWSKVLKFIIALPLWGMLITFILMIFAGFGTSFNPSAQIEKAQQQSIQSK